jgi:hypothetical protein
VVGTAVWTVLVAGAAGRFRGGFSYSLFDDAMVSMRYAHNLADGHGLVWNAGQAGVEGYTNFGWTLWMTVLHLTGASPAVLALVVAVTGILVLGSLVVVTAAAARRLAPEEPAVGAVAGWLTALCLPLLFWTLRGMEVGLVALVLAGAVALTLRLDDLHGDPPRRLTLGLVGLMVVGPLIRTDVALPLAVVALGATLLARPGTRRTRALALFVPLVATVAVHTAARWWWYGDPLPNTYYLKLGDVPIGDRLGRGGLAAVVVVVAQLWLPMALAIWALVRASGRDRLRIGLPLAVFATGVGYSVLVGGDAWEWFGLANRYVTAGLPLLYLGTAAGIVRLASAGLRSQRSARPALLAAGTVAVSVVAAAVLDLGVPGAARLLQERLDPDLAARRVTDVLLAALALAVVAVGLRVTSGRPRRRLVIVGLSVAVLALGGVAGIGRWIRDGGIYVSRDRSQADLGTALGRDLPSDTRVAVVWAGAVPYESGLGMVDLLGKSDAVVAQGPNHDMAFWPGHTKWDYSHSIGSLHPDVVLGLWGGPPSDVDDIRSWGYTELDGHPYVFYDAATVDPDVLAAALAETGMAFGR